MGQRQRQKLMAGTSGSQNGLATVRAKANRSSKAENTRTNSKRGRERNESERRARREGKSVAGGGRGSEEHKSAAEQLHPSWAAKLQGRETAKIKPFEGKRVVFD